MSEHKDMACREVPEALERALAAEVSMRARMRHMAVGLAGGCGAALIAVLWLTEPRPLPVRTGVAFATLIVIGLAWAVFAGWVLSRRRPLFALDRVVGARLALLATAMTGTGGTALAAVRGTTAEALTVALAGGALIAIAGLTLVRARSRHSELLRLRATLTKDTV